MFVLLVRVVRTGSASHSCKIPVTLRRRKSCLGILMEPKYKDNDNEKFVFRRSSLGTSGTINHHFCKWILPNLDSFITLSQAIIYFQNQERKNQHISHIFSLLIAEKARGIANLLLFKRFSPTNVEIIRNILNQFFHKICNNIWS